MKAAIIVTVHNGDMPPWKHVRNLTKGPSSTQKAFDEAVKEEYERLVRGRGEVFGEKVSPSLVVMWAYGEGWDATVHIEARLR